MLLLRSVFVFTHHAKAHGGVSTPTEDALKDQLIRALLALRLSHMSAASPFMSHTDHMTSACKTLRCRHK